MLAKLIVIRSFCGRFTVSLVSSEGMTHILRWLMMSNNLWLIQILSNCITCWPVIMLILSNKKEKLFFLIGLDFTGMTHRRWLDTTHESSMIHHPIYDLFQSWNFKQTGQISSRHQVKSMSNLLWRHRCMTHTVWVKLTLILSMSNVWVIN